MLSRLIDRLYFGLRYQIWGPEVPFEDGTVVPEGRPNEERDYYTEEETLEFVTIDWDDDDAQSALQAEIAEQVT